MRQKVFEVLRLINQCGIDSSCWDVAEDLDTSIFFCEGQACLRTEIQGKSLYIYHEAFEDIPIPDADYKFTSGDMQDIWVYICD